MQMYNKKIKTYIVTPEMPKARANKSRFNIMIVHFYIRRELDIIRNDTYFFSMA